MATKLAEADARQIAEDDHLIIEAILVGRIWDELAIPSCQTAKGLRCGLVCVHPCSLAERCINHFIPRYFQNYARWN